MNPTTPTNFDTDVLIVGAGPTGLTLAAALAARGVHATVIDRQAAGRQHLARRGRSTRARSRCWSALAVTPRAGGAWRAGAALHHPRPRPRAGADRLRRPADARTRTR